MSGEAGGAQCLLVTAHPEHDWWYTSSGGGHMLIGEPDETDRRVERNLKQWHCSGLERDLCTCATDGSARRCPHHTQEDFDAADRARTAPDAAGIEAALAAGLAAHAHPGEILVGLGDAWMICGCGERFDLEVVDGIVKNPNAAWFAHVAAALLPVVTQAQAEALREAADEVFRAAPDLSAGVPVYRSEIADWLRARADESGGAS